MGHHVDHPLAHQRRQADRGARVVGEDQEGAAIGDHPAMQRQAVHGRGHAVLADAVIDVAALAVVGVEGAEVGGQRVVRAREVGRAADGLGQRLVDHAQHHLGGFAGRHLGRLLGGLLLEGADARGQRAGQLARHDPLELGLAALGQGVEARLPLGARGGAAAADRVPGIADVVGDHERIVGPAIGLAHHLDLVGTQRRAMRAGGVLFLGRAEADMRLARDQRGLVVALGLGQGAIDLFGVMAVDLEHFPARGLEAGLLVGDVRLGDLAVDRDAVVVPQHDQLRQLLPAGEADRLLADAFHQAAVAGDDVGVMVHHLGAETRRHRGLGHREADAVGDALAQRAGGGLDARGMAVFRVPGGLRAELAEVLQLVERHVRVAGQVQQPVEQHRAVSGREDEAVAVGPVGVGRVEFQVFLEQHGGDVGHAHRHAGVAGVRGLDRVDGQHAQRGRLGEMFGMLGAKIL